MIDDLYIHADDIDRSICYPENQSNEDKLRIIAAIISATVAQNYDEFSVDLADDGIFRCQLLKTRSGTIIAARRHAIKLPVLNELGLPGAITRWLSSPELCKGGLVAIVGPPGSGKTTTCAAVIASRLSAHGGVCITIEDPPEYNLQGAHGKGVCWQIPVTDDKSYRDAMKGALRGYPAGVPSILMMGEVRDSAAASSVLNASIDGRLVLITLHAGDTRSALGRLRALATDALGIDQANYLVAESLRGVLHQKLQGGRISADLLIATDVAKATIRGGKYEYLGSEIERQRTLMGLNQPVK